MLSPTGRSRMWDADVDGYARGEGFAAVLLKPLSQAIADNDRIECVIRETGVNQDGRTKGMTMPSATSQSALIRATYSRAGLDLNRREDRPQYFEAHGTGTPAGDPIEAQAVHSTFFADDNADSPDGTLYVGSIKTVIGHLEGTAGLAGVLKASLAMRQGIIPPNMHFNRLNPKIEPFYDNLCVPTQPTAWPELPEGAVRRASVNSFGFGGTNAHAIIEAWTPQPRVRDQTLDVHHGPFTLSAHSKTALTAAAASLAETLKGPEPVSLADLGYTLARRSQLQFSAAFSATTRDELVEKLEDAVKKGSFGTKATSVSEKLPLRILGVFTGQGAQWASMGAELYKSSALFRKTIHELEESLSELPDGPSWSLSDQLLADKSRSKINQASVSQPLCTALQVALVELLRAAGIGFSAVVGHSSGEIGAAYAAGYLSAWDAIRIAYYRGVTAPLAQGPGGQRGMMMAVGMSLEEATAFCQRAQFKGRIAVAASNSRSSVTLSGDADAIEEAQILLEERGTFARPLKVDTAYHSHHMQACAGPYLEALQRCNIQLVDGPLLCNWYSSVYGPNGRSIGVDPTALKGQYWVDNMVQTVLFSQAVHRAVTEEHCHDMVLEVGPHPALKGPASETIKTVTGVDLPYSGVLKRGAHDMNTFSDALGFISTNFLSPKPFVNLSGLRKACLDDSYTQPKLLSNLPSYAWDHDKILFKESRKSKAFRTRTEPIHELLGTANVNGQRDEVRWRNVLRIEELEWLRGHVFQSQTLYPATGYIAMAYEAAIRLVNAGQPIRVVDLHDLVMKKGLTLDDDSAGTEVTFVIRVASRTDSAIHAECTCYSGDVDAKADASQEVEGINFLCKVVIELGEPQSDALPPRVAPKLPMEPVSVDRLYASISEIGIDYSRDFLVDSVQRRLDYSTVTTKRIKDSALRVHPATLDACIHSVFAAFSWPGDGRLWTSYLPTGVQRVRINMPCATGDHEEQPDEGVIADCHLTEANAKVLKGDVSIFCRAHGHPEIQVQGLTCSSFTNPRPEDDRAMYSKNVWVRDVHDGIETDKAVKVNTTANHAQMSELFDRVAYYYLRKLRDEVPLDQVCDDWHMQHLMKWVHESVLSESDSPHRIKPEWGSDTEESLREAMAAFPDQVECRLMPAMGENLPAIVRGETKPLEVFFRDNMGGDLYTHGLGFEQANVNLGVLAGQLTHRYPRMNILEIGAGTGGATQHVLKNAGVGGFRTYTYTDISAAFFEKAQGVFSEYADKMIFKTLNVENDPLTQGFEAGGYDLIIASNVLHATKSLENTMSNARKLLRPGGYLMLLEITSMEMLRVSFMVSALSGWFHGIGDGRVWTPTITEDRWDTILKSTGYSGVDTAARDSANPNDYGFSAMVSQAVDDHVSTIREPLAWAPAMQPIDDLIIVGGQHEESAAVVSQVKDFLAPFAENVSTFSTLEECTDIPYSSSIVCVSDLDSPVFRGMTAERFQGVHNVFTKGRHILWVTRGARDGVNPEANMTIGLGRSVLLESTYTRLQFLDLAPQATPAADLFAKSLLRLAYADEATAEETGLLWSLEHELVVENDGAIYVPRIRPNETLNLRHNSDKRIVTDEIDPVTDPVEFVVEKDGQPILQRVQRSESQNFNPSVDVDVHVSSSHSFTTSDGRTSFLSIGQDAAGQRVLTLSATSRSFLTVPGDCIFDIPPATPGDDNELLHRLVLSVLAESIAGDAAQGTIWVHEPYEGLADVLVEAARRQGVELFFTTCQAHSSDARVQQIHPCITAHDLDSLLPADVTVFTDLSRPVHESLAETINTVLGPSVEINKAYTSINGRDSLQMSFDDFTLREVLQQGASVPAVDLTPAVGAHEVVNASATALQPTSVLNWASSAKLPVRVKPIDHASLFSPDKTYLMIGLTGDLGLSLCDWMVSNGARHVVLTSRNPKVAPEVLESLQRKGSADVRIMPLDIADKAALEYTVDEISATMPPIGGVANAAMVLRDMAFENMTWEAFNDVLAPKVKGTQNLDEIFHDTPLDFFVLFSSVACIVGNSGQANYSAANMYMAALAQQRRTRGVAASIIHIAMLLGVGYVARAIDKYENSLQNKYKYMAISETGFRDIFGEAIVAGRPGAPYEQAQYELITGLGKDPDAAWCNNPRFSHYLVEDGDGASGGQKKQGGQGASLKGQLAEASSEEETVAVVEQGFANKLGLILQIDAAKISYESSLMNLGIDSLVAVEIRSWFLKELGIDMPVLKILSGASLTDLCKDALARYNAAAAGDKTQAEPESTMPTIDWKQELASLLEGLPPKPAGQAAFDRRDSGVECGLSIVMTGTTGFLGKHILSRLVDNPRVDTIHCIAIRADSSGKPRHAAVQHPKIVEYTGDLSAPRLGLSDADFDMLSREADAIIHNGADVSFLKSYTALRAINVLSSRSLLEMAVSRSVPLHFISTAAVALFTPEKEMAEVSSAHFKPPADGVRGYATSKWMNEVLLEAAAESHGVPAVVHRAVNIVGEGAPETDLITALDTYTRVLNAVPALKGGEVDGDLDIVDVDEVAGGVADLAVEGPAKMALGTTNETGYTVVNYCAEVKVKPTKIKGYMEMRVGHRLNEMPFQTWLEKSAEKGMNKPVNFYLQDCLRQRKPIAAPCLRKGVV